MSLKNGEKGISNKLRNQDRKLSQHTVSDTTNHG